jgi:hypothetical protein
MRATLVVLIFGVVARAVPEQERAWPVSPVARTRATASHHLPSLLHDALNDHDTELPLVIETGDGVVSPDQISHVQLDFVTRSADAVVFHRDRRPMSNVRECSAAPRACSLLMIAALQVLGVGMGQNVTGKDGVETVRNVTTGWLFDRLNDATDRSRRLGFQSSSPNFKCQSCLLVCSSFYYHSSKKPSPLFQAISSIANVEALELRSATSASSSMNVWVGGGGVAAACHYDASLNLFWQMHGTKHFFLLPPTADMRVYSFLHPLWRRSQHPIHAIVNGTTADAVALLGRSAHQAIQAVLQPGDILYIPPFWFHHVVAQSPISISANVWTTDELMHQLARAVSDGPRLLASLAIHSPEGAERAPSKQTAAVILERVLERLVTQTLGLYRHKDGRKRGRAWIRQMALSRWQPLFDRFPKIGNRTFGAKFCAAGMEQRRASIANQLLGSSDDDDSGAAENFVNGLAEVYSGLPPGAIELEIGNLAESFANEVLNNTRIVGDFLVNCFG